MKLTKKELAQKLINGEKLCSSKYYIDHYCYFDETYTNPFRLYDIKSDESFEMDNIWKETEWEKYEDLLLNGSK